jgi:hypothetical protein
MPHCRDAWIEATSRKDKGTKQENEIFSGLRVIHSFVAGDASARMR